jgi:hypothetical protein
MKTIGREPLEKIPGVGKAVSQDLCSIGIRSADDLKGKSAERLYEKLCDFKAAPVDKCMLYVLRCAIYYASNPNPDPHLLKWNNWKSRKSPF